MQTSGCARVQECVSCMCMLCASLREIAKTDLRVHREAHRIRSTLNRYKCMRLHRPPRNPHNTAARIGQTPDDREETKVRCCDSTAVFPCFYMPTEASFLSWAMETIPCFGSAIEELTFEMRKSVPTEVWHGVFEIKYEWDKSR